MTNKLLLLAALVATAGCGFMVGVNYPKRCGTDRQVGKPTSMPDPPEARKTFPIVCDQSSWTPSQQKRYGDLREKLHAAVRETRELPNGYEFRFPGEESLCLAAAEFIMLERQCCPFFNFVIEMESGEGHLFLRLTGDEGAKQLLREKLGL